MITKYNEFDRINEELIGSILLGGIFTFILVSIIKMKLWKFIEEEERGIFSLQSWNTFKLIYRWLKTFRTYRKHIPLILKLDKNLKKNDEIKYEINEILGKYTFGNTEGTQISTKLNYLKLLILDSCDRKYKNEIEDLLDEFEDEINKIIKSSRISDYQKWCEQLDKSMKNNDIAEFSKYYNIRKSKWKEKYKNERPEYIDIIDGANIGLFSLKEV